MLNVPFRTKHIAVILKVLDNISYVGISEMTIKNALHLTYTGLQALNDIVLHYLKLIICVL